MRKEDNPSLWKYQNYGPDICQDHSLSGEKYAPFQNIFLPYI